MYLGICAHCYSEPFESKLMTTWPSTPNTSVHISYEQDLLKYTSPNYQNQEIEHQYTTIIWSIVPIQISPIFLLMSCMGFSFLLLQNLIQDPVLNLVFMSLRYLLISNCSSVFIFHDIDIWKLIRSYLVECPSNGVWFFSWFDFLCVGFNFYFLLLSFFLCSPSCFLCIQSVRDSAFCMEFFSEGCLLEWVGRATRKAVGGRLPLASGGDPDGDCVTLEVMPLWVIALL